ncbi:MAG: 60S ribosomal export protein NMD3 [Candidatus Marsarchaeota archaeon]|nr:60S ribosomal export protein NMD3 [Candidatus Marsarchaeota archaeon]
MIKFCPTCNRSSNDAKFIGEFCEYCTAEKLESQLPKSVKLHRCKVCGNIHAAHGFVHQSHESLEEAINQQAKLQDCTAKLVSFNEYKGIAIMDYACSLQDGDVEFEHSIKVAFTKEMCPSCYRKSSGYYEAIIQVRGNNSRVAQFIESFTKFLAARDAFVSKTEEEANGMDFYVSSKRIVGDYFMLHKSMKPKVSYKLYGMKKGKKLYRHIYSLRFDQAANA